MSTWPVAGGVVAERGVVYAAAGIAHYDGTHVYALDAVNGNVRWYNGTCGQLAKKVNSGISLQGGLFLQKEDLCFGGGNIHPLARYALLTGECLNRGLESTGARSRTAFYAYCRLASAYKKHRFMDQALAHCRVLLARFPETPRRLNAYKLKLEIHKGLKNYRNVLATLAELKAEMGQDLDAYKIDFETAWIHFDLCRYPKAVELIRRQGDSDEQAGSWDPEGTR